VERENLVRSLKSRFKSSFIRDAYWAVRYRERLKIRQQEVSFYETVLAGFRRGNLIFDIGANEGAKTDVFLRLGARVVDVEPDGACSRSLEERFLQLRIRPRPVTIVNIAVSNRLGTEEMLVDGPGSAVNTLSPKWAETLKQNKANFTYAHCGLEFKQTRLIETTTIDELIVQHGVPFFVKIDVEGHELSALRGLNRPIPYLSFEVNLPEFRPEGLQCVQVLAALAKDGQFNFASDCTLGLNLKEWVPADEFSTVLERCSERSIEVFWRTTFPGSPSE
jgi:FkbM family methyltransferase